MRASRIFFALALIAMLALAAGEAALRFVGWGGDPQWIYEAGRLRSGETLCIVQPDATRHLPAGQISSSGVPTAQTSFVMPKPADTVRIFLLGESAAKGDPQPRNLAVSSFLQAMLSDALQGKKIEVINLGTQGISSAPMISQVREAARYAPDLFIFYTGNNEFFGARGVRGEGALRFLPGIARGSAVAQWLASRFRNGVSQSPVMPHTTIAADSPLREEAAHRLSANLGRMIDEARSAGVPSVVCTTAGNESGLAPLGDDDTGGLDAKQQRELKRLMDEAMEASAHEDHVKAVNLLRQAVQLAPRSARSRFLLGKVLAAAGQGDPARVAFLEARDLDTLPLRPISLTEQAVRNTALVKGAVLCDVAEIFRRESHDGATGWDLLDDDVHLSLSGQARAARSMVGAMANLSPPLQLGPDQLALVRDDSAYADELGTNVYDTYAVNRAQRDVFAAPWIKETNGAAFKVFDELCREEEKQIAPSVMNALNVHFANPRHGTIREPVTAIAARMLMQEGRNEEALDLWELAARQVPEYTPQFLEYVYFALACRQKLDGELGPDALALAARAIAQGELLLGRNSPEGGVVGRYTAGLHQLRGEWVEAIPLLLAARTKLSGEESLAADQALVLAYLKSGKKDEALALADQEIKRGDTNSSFYKSLREAIAK